MHTDLVTNLGPVPLVPWGTAQCFGKNNNTMRRLLLLCYLGVGVAVISQ